MRKLISVITACMLAFCLCSCSFADYLHGFVSEDDGAQDGEAGAESDITNDITVGLTDFDEYNPFTTKSPTVRDICGFIFEPLFGLDGDLKTTGVLAQSYVYSADGTGVTINLKQNVKWHDGTAFTAADVVYTINRIKTGGTPYDDLAAPIASARAVDDTTLEVKFNRAVPNSAALFIFPIVKNGSMNGSFSPVGTGPFYYDGANLTAFSDHHDTRAKLDRINIRAIPDNDKYVSLFNASVTDIATSEMLDMSNYMPRGNAKVRDFISNDMVFIGYNMTSPVFADNAARKAVSMLIDRDDVVTRIYYSRAVASEYALNPASWLGFDDRKKLRADENGAVSLLENAGWKTDGNGTYYKAAPAGITYFSVRILVNSESEERVKLAAELANKMNTIGMRANVIECTASELNYRINIKDYDLFVGETELLPNNDLTPLAASSGNYFGYADPDTDTLLAQMGTVSLDADMKAVAKELYGRVYEDMPFSPVCFIKNSIVTSAKIKTDVSPSVEGYVRMTENWGVK